MANASDRIKELMEQKNITQQELSESTGISKSLISLYLNGKRSPKIDKVYIIAKYYNVDPVWLMGFDVPKELDIKKYEEPAARAKEDAALLAKYHRLNDKYKEAILRQIDMFIDLQSEE